MAASKTVNPLHFEDLEPHRFEDLVRQLAYDLKSWRSIEATGRLGSDDGFDARAIETTTMQSETENEESEYINDSRVWLIQCKREKRITPKKLEQYATDCLFNKPEKIYGFIIAAPCDFSKKARDSFIAKLREYNVQEYIIWGKAELEDLLFQPKNDHLLFAYFQISLQVNRRTAKTRIRSKLATKKKAFKVLGGLHDYYNNTYVLVRDPDEIYYPYSSEVDNFDKDPTWIVREFQGYYHGGLMFLWKKFFAYIDDKQQSFDFARAYDDSNPYENPWPPTTNSNELKSEIEEFWFSIPEQNRGWIEVTGYIPYEDIIAIDEDGDEEFEGPHIYVPFSYEKRPFGDGYYAIFQYSQNGAQIEAPDLRNRIEFFPKKYREPK